MKVILCVGDPNSRYQGVFDVLVRAGVVRAQPAGPTGFFPQKLQSEMLRSQEIDLDSADAFTQATPGKQWTQLASELFLANTSYAVWGWADHQTVVWLDYWQAFEPQVRLLLVYQSLHAHLAQMLDQCSMLSPLAVSNAVNQWMRWNGALLRYYHRHTDRCALINSEHAMAQPQALLGAVERKWQLDGLNLVDGVAMDKPSFGHLQQHLVGLLVDPLHPALALNQELDGTALLASIGSDLLASDCIQDVWVDWVNARTQLASNTFKEEEKKELRQEIELLELHRDQMQEELEHYFFRCQELGQQLDNKETEFVTEFWRRHQPLELVIDMREVVVGRNWYHAEVDGRWAGPELVSTVQMPPLQPGDYTLSLEVVDAMHPEIVTNMVLEVCGQRTPFDIEMLSPGTAFPLLCLAQLRIAGDAALTPWPIAMHFPRLVSPSEFGGDDVRNLAIRVQRVRLRKQ